MGLVKMLGPLAVGSFIALKAARVSIASLAIDTSYAVDQYEASIITKAACRAAFQAVGRSSAFATGQQIDRSEGITDSRVH